MNVVKGAVVALYKNRRGAVRFAVLRRVAGWDGWELVKGQREDEDASDKETAFREVKEETGIAPETVKSLDMTHTWEYERKGKKYRSEYHVFIAEAPEHASVTVTTNEEQEHADGYFLNYRDARDILEYNNQKKLLDRAMDIIKGERAR